MRFNIGRISDILSLAKLLEVGLRNLTFKDNFNSNVIEVELPPTSEIIVPHTLKKVPSYYIIGRKSNQGDIIDGTTWNDKNISLTNLSGNTIKITLIVME